MKPRSHEPIVWSLFGAGGMLAALIGPVLVLMIGILIPLGIGFDREALSYETVLGLLQNPLIGLALAVVISLFLFHGAHRMIHTLHDFGVSASGVLKLAGYGLATLGTVIAVVLAWGL